MEKEKLSLETTLLEELEKASYNFPAYTDVKFGKVIDLSKAIKLVGDYFDKKKKEKDFSYGIFKVHKENPFSSKTEYVGTYEGYIDEIAFALADQSGQPLIFSPVDYTDFNKEPKKKVVEILINYEGDYNLSKQQMMDKLENCTLKRGVRVYNAKHSKNGILLTTKPNYEDDIKKRALEKLTEEEKKILGLEE